MDYITAQDIQEMTGRNYNTVLEWLKLIHDKQYGRAYVVDRAKFINWASQNNIKIHEQAAQ